MSKLHFLDFYSKGSCSCLGDQGGLYLPQGLESLSNELRYLRWTHYPLESLPSKFSAENLVELNLPYSRLKKLWQEAPVSIMFILSFNFYSMNSRDLTYIYLQSYLYFKFYSL